MKFVANDSELAVLGGAADVLRLDEPAKGVYVDLDDDRLINIARSLGMEEVLTVQYTGTTITTVSDEFAKKMLGVEPVETPTVVKASVETPKNGVLRNCDICGQPVTKPRSHTCSDECKREKTRRYLVEYNKRKSDEKDELQAELDEAFEGEGAGSVDPAPLPQAAASSRTDLADPAFEAVRVSGL